MCRFCQEVVSINLLKGARCWYSSSTQALTREDQVLVRNSEQTRYGGTTTAWSKAAGMNKRDSESETASLRSTRSTVSTRSVPLSTTKSGSSIKGAKPIGQFQYLERSFKVNVPTSPLPQANDLFKSVCERYDIAVVNREKVDEALTDFKKVLGMDLNASFEECFSAWKDYLVNPRFTITCKDGTGDVKDIRVIAESIPTERRKAQKHMRDLLDASHLFLQQREFLQRHIVNDMSQLEQVVANLETLAREANLSSSEKKQLTKTISSAQRLFSGFSDILETFWRQVYSLVQNINTAIHVLDGVSQPGSLAPV